MPENTKKDAPDFDKREVLKRLREIPGVGKSVSEDLWNLGMRDPRDLRGKDPEDLYRRLCEMSGIQIDRCMLYVFRCAVYYASCEKHDPELLKWWNWKDPNRRTARRRKDAGEIE